MERAGPPSKRPWPQARGVHLWPCPSVNSTVPTLHPGPSRTRRPESRFNQEGGDRAGKTPGLLTAHLLSTCCAPPAPQAGRLEVVRPRDVAQRRLPPPLSPGLVGRQLGREKRPLPAATAGLQIKGGREPSLPPRPLGAPKDSARRPASHSHHPAGGV